MSARILAKLAIIFCIYCCMGYQNEYTVKQEWCEVEFVNKTTCEFYCNTYYMNRTHKALNLTMLYKKPDKDMKVLISAYMWMTNLYKLIAIQLELKFISVLSYRFFDIENLIKNYSRPPMKSFPLPNVKYVFKGWIPNSKTYVPGLRSGKYKIRVVLCNANKDVNYAIGNWYFTAEDIIRY